MGQHKNNAQIEIFIKFMEQHPDLARGFVKGDRVRVEKLWEDLANDLNASGPPKKNVSSWKKVWTDWKLNIKQRLSHNKVELNKTGGGRFNQFIISPSDEQVAIISCLYASVDGVENIKTYGAQKKQKSLTNENLPATSAASQATSSLTSPSRHVTELNEIGSLSTSTNQSPLQINPDERLPSPQTKPTTPVRSHKRKRHVVDAGDVMQMEAEHFSKMASQLEKIKGELKENRRYLKELSRNAKDTNKTLSDLKKIKENELKEMMRHNYEMEKKMQTKNELKLQFLEIEQMKIQSVSSNL